jgi:hypothetical protein
MVPSPTFADGPTLKQRVRRITHVAFCAFAAFSFTPFSPSFVNSTPASSVSHRHCHG